MHVWCASERVSVVFVPSCSFFSGYACVFFSLYSIGSVTSIHRVVWPLPFLPISLRIVSSSASHFDVRFHCSMAIVCIIYFDICVSCRFLCVKHYHYVIIAVLLLFDCLKNLLQFVWCVVCIDGRGVTSCFWTTAAAAVFHSIYYVIIMIELTGEQKNEWRCFSE